MPAEVGEVQNLPLDPAVTAVECEGEQEGAAEAESSPLRKEKLLPCKDMPPPPAHGTAGRVQVQGQTEKASESKIIGKARD